MNYKKGRGAQINTNNSFEKNKTREWFDDIPFEEREKKISTRFIEVYPKTIVNKNNSPDVPNLSMNPYQGCEHGCIYCYARPTHEYWGYSAGIDFEQTILVKKNAAELLSKKLQTKKWEAKPIMLSGNTDCYQPAERKFMITRKILEVFLEHQHPVGIITKNSLILRDLDILKKLAKNNLVQVAISITSLKEETRRILEPRTASVNQKLKTIKTLSDNDIPVMVMNAPIIPAINSDEILNLAKKVSENGAKYLGYTIVRLNGSLAELFTDWVQKNFPDRAEKVLNQIRDIHGGELSDSRYKTRMRGEGKIAESIREMFKIARQKYFPEYEFKFNISSYIKNPNNNQLSLF